MSEPMRHTEHDGHAGGGTPGHTGHVGHVGHTEHMGHEGHAEHEGHDHHAHTGHTGKVTWRTAASATLHCLTGCAIGEVLGMVIGTALGWSNAPVLVLSVALAFVFGYALTLTGLRRAGVGWRDAVRLALAADTASIIVMEITDNAVMVAVPGAMDAGLGSGLFWGALAFSLLAAFLVTTPVNKWIIGRGRGHAVVHAYHH
ncbi:DUF4396 domain-containing protein [Streptosporangium sp. NPDC051023]|uniref:DUF4396 domain-containing protein n=1 Tax=Streptosporangium sp. NPDC051023 TaxID=3155410 RepID=UPI00344D36E1